MNHILFLYYPIHQSNLNRVKPIMVIKYPIHIPMIPYVVIIPLPFSP